MKVLHTLNPIYNKDSKVLILGSMPSVKSRELNFYYANKQNRFWQIMEIIFNKKLIDDDSKKEFLLQNKIALWDTIYSCDIKGSSDTTIKNIKYNNFDLILGSCPIKAIFCTGKKSYNLFIKHYKGSIPVFYLPSPSGANAAFSLDKLCDYYKEIKVFLEEK